MSANMDLVTSHRGVAHITTQNVIDLIAGLSGDISGVKIFPQLYDGLDNVIESTTRVKIKTGAGLAGGYFFILNEAFNWNLDPGSVGYSRIDVLYLVIYEDYGTTVQSSDLVYRVGTAYPNGQSGQVPSAPSGTNIIATFPLLRANMTDGALVDTMSYADLYESNSSINAAIAQMRVDFQDGVDTIYNAIVAEGVTPSASTPDACATGIATVATNKRNQGRNDTYSANLKVETYEDPEYDAGGNIRYKLGIRATLTINGESTEVSTYKSNVDWSSTYSMSKNKNITLSYNDIH